MNKKLFTILTIAAFVGLSGCSSNRTHAPHYADSYDMTEHTGDQSGQQRYAPAPPDQNTLKPLAINDIPSTGEPIGGSIEKNMDRTDRNRMLKALDKAPGKTTTWKNNRTAIKYVVVPTRKIVINDNPFCRRYQTTATRGTSSKQMTGTACVGSDGNWHSVE